MNIWMFLSVVAVGPVKECNRLASALLTGESFRYNPPENLYVNFGYKNNGPNSGDNSSTNKDEREINLQRICAEKVLALYDENKLQASDIMNIPVDVLQKIVECIPLTVPTTEADEFKDRWDWKLVRPAVKFNFNKQEQFINKVKELRPDLPSNWADEVNNNRQGMLMFNLDRNALSFTDPAALLIKFKENDLHLNVVGRVSCDWDGVGRNNFTKVFVLENDQVAFNRKDIPKEIQKDDHPMMKKYGHLLLDWNEIRTDKINFETKEFGEFKLLYTARRVE